MAATVLEPGIAKKTYQICRLCLSEDSLEDVFKEEGLHQWISDYLSITISTGDSMSQGVCVICRIRLTEFHQFRLRCQEVQDVLRALEENDSTEVDRKLLTHEIVPSYHLDQKSSKKHLQTLEESSHERINDKETIDVRTSGLEDMIDIEYIKVEANGDDNVVLPDVTIDQLSSLSNDVDNDNNNGVDKTQIDTSQISQKQNTSPYNPCHKKYKNKRHRTKQYDCKACKARFAKSRDLARHKRTNKHLTKQKFFEIEELNESKKRQRDEIESLLKHINEDEYSCPSCSCTFKEQCQFKTHMMNHLSQIEAQQLSLIEDTQPEEVVSKSDAHMSSAKQSLETKETFVSETRTCDKPEPKENLASKPWKCGKCDKSYADKIRLRNHQRFHKPKNFKCPICEKPFFQQCLVYKHIPSHNAVHTRPPGPPKRKCFERSYKCNFCEKAFMTHDTLSSHKRQVHGPKLHDCHICGSKFAQRNHLMIHVRSHYPRNVGVNSETKD